jgi:peptide/nickel transport system substrate-binding protein
MKRRGFLAAGAAAVTGLSRPALAQGDARVLRFVPQGVLGNLDPIWASSAIARNHGYLIWDTLYGRTTQGGITPQMAAGHEMSDDRLKWRFTLREGLYFHDGEPVLAQDCVASILRWAVRRGFGQKLQAQIRDIRASNDRQFTIRLLRPYPRMLEALGSDTCFIMPERVSRTDAFTQISDHVGSGPFRFENDEWVAGSRAVYSRFDKYSPVDRPPDFTSGAKLARFERVEWIAMPDPVEAETALLRGEIDWWQTPVLDRLAFLRASPGVTVARHDPVGVVAMVALNHLHPPFDNKAIRQAVLAAVDQKRFVAAAMASAPELGRTGVGIFTAGQPCASAVGMDVLNGPRDPARARRLLAGSGYRHEPVVLLSPTDNPLLRALSQIAAELFTGIGLNVSVQPMEWAALMARRASHAPTGQNEAGQAGWSAFCTTYEGLSVASPAGHLPLRGTGTAGWFGWPSSPRIEVLRDAWFDAADLPAEQRVCDDIQRVAFDEVPYLPVGQWYGATALRSTITDVVAAPFPIFWNAHRS